MNKTLRWWGGFVMIAMSASSLAVAATERSTESFRKEHVAIREHLDHLSTMAGLLPNENSRDQRETMKKIVEFLKGHIKPHAEWEERVLYPVVDKRAGSQSSPFTATMRNDHKIIGRWIGELETAASQSKTDAKQFARKTDRLLGLITAHFENEEDVLLPVLDRTMSKSEFEKEIMSKAER